ncbi:hypothetical protein ABZX75_31745 [Streptomyces sp. NPDC003038]|uniref:hypothetical protein n=1 Tax=unclassified Streptomyces TaxID=2593676 RepID=UPI0033B2254A
MTRIVLVSGSLRGQSVNSAALATVRAISDRRAGEFETPELSVADGESARG